MCNYSKKIDCLARYKRVYAFTIVLSPTKRLNIDKKLASESAKAIRDAMGCAASVYLAVCVGGHKTWKAVNADKAEIEHFHGAIGCNTEIEPKKIEENIRQALNNKRIPATLVSIKTLYSGGWFEYINDHETITIEVKARDNNLNRLKEVPDTRKLLMRAHGYIESKTIEDGNGLPSPFASYKAQFEKAAAKAEENDYAEDTKPLKQALVSTLSAVKRGKGYIVSRDKFFRKYYDAGEATFWTWERFEIWRETRAVYAKYILTAIRAKKERKAAKAIEAGFELKIPPYTAGAIYGSDRRKGKEKTSKAEWEIICDWVKYDEQKRL